MTQSPFEPPNKPSRQSEPPATGPSRPLTFDEMIALLVAFLALGSVLFWGLSRGGMDTFQASLATAETALDGTRPPLDRNRPFDLDDRTAADETTILERRQLSESNALRADETDSASRGLAERTRRDRRTTIVRQPDQNNIVAGVAGATAGVAGVAAVPSQAVVTPEEIAPSVSEPEDALTTPVTEPVPLSENAQADPKDAIFFSDVPENYWARPYIDALSSRELIAGFDSGEFRPDQPVTRSQVANIVSRTFDLTADKETLAFSDVDADYWARESIGEVVKGGFMTGFPDDTFAPNAPITRTQALTTLVTGLSIPTPTNVQATLSRYADADEIPNWANEKVAAATAGNLVVNYPNQNRLQPTAPTTRAELSAMIYQALVREGAVEPVDSEYMVKP